MSALEGQRFQDTEHIKKKKKKKRKDNVTTALKPFHNRSTKNVSDSGNIIELHAKLLKVIFSVSFKYTRTLVLKQFREFHSHTSYSGMELY
jgi:hypothetical protein